MDNFVLYGVVFAVIMFWWLIKSTYVDPNRPRRFTSSSDFDDLDIFDDDSDFGCFGDDDCDWDD